MCVYKVEFQRLHVLFRQEKMMLNRVAMLCGEDTFWLLRPCQHSFLKRFSNHLLPASLTQA